MLPCQQHWSLSWWDGTGSDLIASTLWWDKKEERRSLRKLFSLWPRNGFKRASYWNFSANRMTYTYVIFLFKTQSDWKNNQVTAPWSLAHILASPPGMVATVEFHNHLLVVNHLPSSLRYSPGASLDFLTSDIKAALQWENRRRCWEVCRKEISVLWKRNQCLHYPVSWKFKYGKSYIAIIDHAKYPVCFLWLPESLWGRDFEIVGWTKRALTYQVLEASC